MYFDDSVARGYAWYLNNVAYSVDEPLVRRDGVSLSADNSIPPTATNDQILNASVADGEFVYNSSLIKVGGTEGLVTMDASGLWDHLLPQGPAIYNVKCNSNIVSGIGGLIRRLTGLEIYFDDNVPHSIVSFYHVYGELCGDYITKQVTLREYVSRVLTNAGYLLIEQPNGLIWIKKREGLSPENVVGTIKASNIISGSERRGSVLPVDAGYSVVYARDWSKASTESLSETSTRVEFVDNIVTKSKPIRRVDSSLLEKSEAKKLSETISKDGRRRLVIYFSAVNELYRFKAGDLIYAELKTVPSGAYLEVLSVKENNNRNRSDYEVIAYE